jgi:hypothetical protein
VEKILTFWRNITNNQQDGDLPSKYMQSLQELKHFNKPVKDSLIKLKFLKEVF